MICWEHHSSRFSDAALFRLFIRSLLYILYVTLSILSVISTTWIPGGKNTV